MITGVGLDVVDISHFEKVLDKGGKHFVERVFSKSEQEEAQKLKTQAARIRFFAKRYAAKEAFVKALGTGFGALAVDDIWVEKTDAGQPKICLSEKAQKYMKKVYKRPMHIHLSLSDDGVAAAIVVLERM